MHAQPAAKASESDVVSKIKSQVGNQFRCLVTNINAVRYLPNGNMAVFNIDSYRDRMNTLEEEVRQLKYIIQDMEVKLNHRTSVNGISVTPKMIISEGLIWDLRLVDLPDVINNATIRIAYSHRNVESKEDILATATSLAKTREQLTRELFVRTFTLREIYCKNVRGVHQSGEKRPCRGLRENQVYS